MIIAGPCLMATADEDEIKNVVDTARQLVGTADLYRCKLWGGGTVPEKYVPGVGVEGVFVLSMISKDIMPTATEVQTEHQIWACDGNIDVVWIGARNSQNYGLLECLRHLRHSEIMIKRGFGMPISETIGMYDIMTKIIKKDVYLVDRGINTFDRQPDSRWSPDLRGVLQIKNDRPDIFDKLVIDCSHSVFRKSYIPDVYRAFKSVGCQHFMFECMARPEQAVADKAHCLSVKELKEILR